MMVLMRLPLLGWVLLCAGTQLAGLSTRSTRDPGFRLSDSCGNAAIDYRISVADRRGRYPADPPSAKPRSGTTHLGLLGTFLMYGIVLFPAATYRSQRR